MKAEPESREKASPLTAQAEVQPATGETDLAGLRDRTPAQRQATEVGRLAQGSPQAAQLHKLSNMAAGSPGVRRFQALQTMAAGRLPGVAARVAGGQDALPDASAQARGRDVHLGAGQRTPPPPGQGKTASSGPGVATATGSSARLPVQRTERDAKKYVSENGLWREGHNLISLLAALFLERSPEFWNVYEHLVRGLPTFPVKATDGHDPPTVAEVQMALDEEIKAQQARGGDAGSQIEDPRLIELARHYLQCSPKFDALYKSLVEELTRPSGEGKEAAGGAMVHEVDRALWMEINRQQQESKKDPMPPKVDQRVMEWSEEVEKKGLKRRTNKKSDGATKRAKMMNAGGSQFRLYHTKTAPTKNKQKPGDQGKSAYFNQNQGEYFRSSLGNVQRGILGLKGDDRVGDVNFVAELDKIYSVEDGATKKPLLQSAMEAQDGTPFGEIGYSKKIAGRDHPGTKLGAEVNSFTYRKLDYSSSTRTYNPATKLGKPKEYLASEGDEFFYETKYLTDQYFDVPEDYESELFGHYRDIVSGARRIYEGCLGQIGRHSLKLVRVDMVKKSAFLNYPAVIFELVNKGNLKADVEDIKAQIIEQWGLAGPVKMTERQSFGFLYPTISDLEKSIRIWPGQYQVESFLNTLEKVIRPQREADEMAVESAESGSRLKMPLLQNTLKRSMNLATSAVSRVTEANKGKSVVKLMFDRIASNYGKGLKILSEWDRWTAEVLFVEGAQVIENLNETLLHLSEYYEQSLAQDSFESAVLNHYLKHVGRTGYSMESFYLTHSGQQGSSSAMLFNEVDAAFLKKTIKDRGPIYFETLTGKSEGEQIKLVDPAYNFTCEEEVRDFAGQAIHDAQIYDITNLDPAELPRILKENPNDQVSLYASLSKHFQFGTDSTNLGLVVHLRKKGKEEKDEGRKALGSYVPKGAVWAPSSKLPQKPAHVPAVPSELYHHAALLLDVQTGSGSHGKEHAPEGPQQFFMGHWFSDWHGDHLLEVTNWVGADNQCGIHSLHHLLGTPDSRRELLEFLTRTYPQLSFGTRMTLMWENEWLDQDALIEIAQLCGCQLAVYEFNQQFGRWALAAGDGDSATLHIGRVPHASGGGNDHWVPLRRVTQSQ